MSRSNVVAGIRSIGVLAFALALLAFTPSAFALERPSAETIRLRWEQLRPTHTGSPYASQPRTVSPYATGSLAPGFARDGLNSVNYIRFLAGLPDDVRNDATLASRAAHGAVLLAASEFSHAPPRPSDMPLSFYNLGYSGTSASNIGWGYSSLWRFNFSCADDADSGNIDRLGHRRWLLDPPMLKTGLGYAATYTDTYAFDRSRTTAVSYRRITWPAEGVFPLQMFAAEVPWSITLNPAVYDIASSGQTVTLRRVRDGKTWTFTSADTNTSGEYLNVERSGYGVPNCIIFRPAPTSVGAYRNGDTFDVTLSGGIFLKGTSTRATISYRTEFVSQNRPDAFEPDDSSAEATEAAAGASLSRTFDNPYDRDRLSLSATAGRALELKVAAASGPAGVVATIRDGAGTTVASWTTGAGTSVSKSWTPTANGGYTVELAPTSVFDRYRQQAYTFSVGTARPTRTTIAAPATSAYASATINGRLADDSGSGVSGGRVIVEQSSDGVRWLRVAAITTAPDGTFAVRTSPTRATRYRASYAGGTTRAASASGVVTVKPRVVLTRPTTPSLVKHAVRFGTSTYLKPRHAAGSYPVRFYFYRYDGSSWVLKLTVLGKAANYSSYTRCTASVSLPTTRRWRVRAYHAADSLNAATWSSYRYLSAN